MLVHEHASGDAAHVEAVQEVLNVLVGDGVHTEGLLVLHHPLSHGGHHVVVPITDVNQRLCEAADKDGCEYVRVGSMKNYKVYYCKGTIGPTPPLTGEYSLPSLVGKF